MNIEFLKSSLKNDNIKAFMLMIRRCEGTDAVDGYNYLFGSSPHNTLRFTDMTRHPNIRRPFGDTFSTAAGAYQIMHNTDNELSARLGIIDFSPVSQDIKCVALLSQINCVQKIMDGDFNYAIQKANRIWASLPDSPYGQPVHTMEVAMTWYKHAGGVVA
jgi:muramidase (phage lysozyme)